LQHYIDWLPINYRMNNKVQQPWRIKYDQSEVQHRPTYFHTITQPDIYTVVLPIIFCMLHVPAVRYGYKEIIRRAFSHAATELDTGLIFGT